MPRRKKKYLRQQQTPSGAKGKGEHLEHQKPLSSKPEEEDLLLPPGRDQATGSESTRRRR